MPSQNKVKAWVSGIDEETIKLLNTAAKGDASAMRQAIKRLPDQDHWLAEHFGIGDLIRQLVSTCAFGGDLVSSESLRQEMDILRKELTEANATPLERMLIEQVIMSWLWMQFEDTRAANNLNTPGPVAHGEYWQRRQERAHSRYLASLTALARVRRLQIPAVQVNIAERGANQLNIATSATAQLDPPA